MSSFKNFTDGEKDNDLKSLFLYNMQDDLEISTDDDTEMVDTLDLDVFNNAFSDVNTASVLKDESFKYTNADVKEIMQEVFVSTDDIDKEKKYYDVIKPENKEQEKESEHFYGFSEKEPALDEVTEIAKGTLVDGDMDISGSVSIYGKVKGDISCFGKISATGIVQGNIKSKDLYTNGARIEGNIQCDNCIKIGNGTVVIGSVTGAEAVIGGAVKGDIDINGSVTLEATAVVKGDIRCRSVQINNGAVIDGHCSQCYADIDFNTLFEETF